MKLPAQLFAFWLGLAQAQAQLLPLNLPSRRTTADLPPGNSPAMLMFRAAADCGASSKGCDDGCIPTGGQCCGTGQGGWCSPGTQCQTGGCCPDGQACPGGAAGACPRGSEFCGDKCMPAGAQCCAENLYFCAAGSACTANGLCNDGRGGAGCTPDEESCAGACMPAGKRCCSTHYCSLDFNCGSGPFECAASTSQGGGGGDGGGGGSGGDTAALCAGEGNFEACGVSCMPRGGVCCDGFYCPASSTCAPGRKCAMPNGDETNADEGGSGTSTSTTPAPTNSGANPSGTDTVPETTDGAAPSMTTSIRGVLLLTVMTAMVHVL